MHIDFKKKIENIKKEIIDTIPEVTFASDQFTREYDLAVITNEHSIHLDQGTIEKIIGICWKHHAEYKISNIHLNIWFGNYNKAQSVIELFYDFYKIDSVDLLNQSIYIGDSPNDEPMFRLIPCSVGVNNIRKFT